MSEHRRAPGTLPRSVSILSALALAAATGTAVWLLPTTAAPEREPVDSARAGRQPVAVTATPTPSRRRDPTTFVSYVNTARTPELNLPDDAQRTGVRWYLLGHIVAAPDGCTPKWSGQLDPAGNPVANRLTRLRSEGGDALLAFGGPGGRDLASTCRKPLQLAQAYRNALDGVGAAHADFEADDGDPATTARRARAIRLLQQQRPLHVTFSLPLDKAAAVLKATHDAGAVVDTVNLLAPIEPQTAPAGRMQRLAQALRTAQRQIAVSQRLTDPASAWRRMAVTAVLVAPGDMSRLDARKLTTFAARHGLAWLSLRGAVPASTVTGILRRTRS
ncbi:hypothetical protein [Nonomuraea soli]|uniref:Chitinase n=1 Tax=Nonomuraea soli TaxID=1032476 RepID=A0A7W0HSZ8_9ACTN|nr:hypothetical protein [Nonomuraea soli]MBA2894457.1 hypothetical protein [Nonomuraea soli]